MSSKGKSPTVVGGGAAGLVPKLRFPEFQGAPSWKYKRLAPFLRDSSERAPSNTALPVFGSTREGLRRQDTYFDGRVLQNNNDYGVVPPGCFVYRHMSDDGSFKFNINHTGGEIAVSKEYPVFETVGLDSKFLLELLNEGEGFKRFAFSQKAGGTRTRLYFSKLCEWHTPLPTLPEQQKIADCLDSVDALIAVQGRKVEAFRAHKMGLMQQLFPQDGETQPYLRFPEFEAAGEWEEAKLQAACTMQAGKFVAASEIQEYAAEDLFPCYGGNGLRGYTASFTHSGKYPLIGRQGALCGNVKFAVGNFHATEHAVVASPKEGVYVDWLFYLLDHLDLNQFATGQAQPGLSVDVLNNVITSIPPNEAEQQRIADCLRSLDDLVAAETRKLETLKTHKKGLMQQLFPQVGEG